MTTSNGYKLDIMKRANFYAVEMSSTAIEIRDGQPVDVPTLIVLGTGFTEDAARDNARRFLSDVITRIYRTELTER